MERGEVQARAGASLAGMLQEHPDWFRDHKIIPLIQIGSERRQGLSRRAAHARAGLRPTSSARCWRLVSSPPSLGRRFFTTPDVPAARVACAARGLRRHHEGRRLPHRGTAAWPRHANRCRRMSSPRLCFDHHARPRSGQGQGRDRAGSAIARQRKRIARPREICNGDAGARRIPPRASKLPNASTPFPTIETPVLIVARPGRLALAGDLGWRRRPVSRDRAGRRPGRTTRAPPAINARSMEFMRRWGVAEAVRNASALRTSRTPRSIARRSQAFEIARIDRRTTAAAERPPPARSGRSAATDLARPDPARPREQL